MLEMIKSLEFATQAIIVFYLIGILFSFGVTMAFISRYIIKIRRTRKEIADMYFVAFCTSLFSWVAVPTLFMTPSFGEYGWKLWHGERRSPANKWYQKIQDGEKRRKHRQFPRTRKSILSAAGDCYSIWE